MNTASGARQSILSLSLKDKAQLYAAYIPYLRGGGIFVPVAKRYALGDEVFVFLTLPESSERIPVAGKVAWVTPTGAQGNRAAGIGVQFPDTPDGVELRSRIESQLGAVLASDKPTLTM